MKKDIVIKIILLVLVVTVISSTLTSLVVTNTLSGNKILGSVNYSDYLDSSNVTYLDSNVQDSIDNLYTQANDYSSINNRLSNVEGYFQNNPTSIFDGDKINIGINSNSSDHKYVNIYNDGKNRGSLLYRHDGRIILTARDESEEDGTGILDLHGNPVMINGVDVSTNNIGVYKGVLSSANNLNDITEAGWYKINGSAPTNAPSDLSSVYCVLLSFGSAAYRTQIIFVYNAMYYRRYTATYWERWYKFTGTVL